MDSKPRKHLVALGIVVGVSLVQRPVNFDGERRGVTIEVHDETGDDLLTPEVKPV